MIKYHDKQITIKAGKCTICGKEVDSPYEGAMHNLEHLANYRIVDIDEIRLPGGTVDTTVFYIKDMKTDKVYEAYLIRSADLKTLRNIDAED